MDFQSVCKLHQKELQNFCLTCFLQEKPNVESLICSDCNPLHNKHRIKQPEDCFQWMKLNIFNLRNELSKFQMNIEQLQKMYQSNKNVLKVTSGFYHLKQQQESIESSLEKQIEECTQNLDQLKKQNIAIQTKILPDTYQN